MITSLQTTKVFKYNLQEFNKGKRIIINQGGQHSSKTYSILQLIIFLAQIVENKVFTIAAESIPFLKTGALRQFLEIMMENEIFDVECWNATERIYKMGSNVIEFKGYDVSSKALGAKRDFLFINEAINVDWDTFSNLEARTNVCTFLDYNPSYQFWAHEKLIETKRDDVAFIKSTFRDNPYLPEKIIQSIEQYQFTDPNRWQVMGLGELGSSEGLVFNNWSIVDDWFTLTGSTAYGMDFGFSNDPSTVVGVTKPLKENIILVDEIFYQTEMTNSDISLMMEQNDMRKHRDEIFCDSAEPKSIEELKRRGWRTKPVLKGKDSINSGIGLLKQYKILVTRRSINLIRELRQYQWVKDRNGKMTNRPSGPDHAIDALRYCTSMKFNISKLGTFKVITMGR